MPIVPVLDLHHGVVVRAVGGRRDEYRPIQSSLVKTPSPTAVLDALLDRFKFQSAYIADIDGITTGESNGSIIQELARRPVELIVDAGVKSETDAQKLFDLGVTRVVAASESLPSAAILKELVAEFSPSRIVFSMDMKSGAPIFRANEWIGLDADAIIDAAIEVGVTHFILLDLADVGEGNGPRTLPLLQRLRKRFSNCWFAVGGGVRSVEDLNAAEQAGADAVLIASALHDGRITPEHIRARTIVEDASP